MDFSIKPPGSSGQRMRRQSTNTNWLQSAPAQTFQAQTRFARSPGPQQPGYGYGVVYGNGNGYGYPGSGGGWYGQGGGEGVYPSQLPGNMSGYGSQSKQGRDDGGSVVSARAPSVGRRAPSMAKLGARLTESVACVLMSGALLVAPKPSKIALGMQPSNAAMGQTRLLILAFPTTTTDIAQLYEAVFLHSLPFNNQPPLYDDDDFDDEDEEEEDEFAYLDRADDDSEYDEFGQKIKRGGRKKSRKNFRNGIVPDILDTRVCMAFGHITKVRT
ncbi:hypothetical protein BC830DRAFT_941583 [Chytriomyces sp. MP71]|nr:hypothetical protein BC830DRAFT_941583 [Chytriomyces sp. MP71]